MDDRVWLAALRATGTAELPDDIATAEARLAAASGAGRQLVPVDLPRGPGWTMTWRDDVAPELESAGSPGTSSANPVIVLAACLRACWTDSAAPLYPGGETTIEHVTQVVSVLGVVQARRALNRLLWWGYLTEDSGRGSVRLGPRVALWSEADIAYLRAEYDLLPRDRTE